MDTITSLIKKGIKKREIIDWHVANLNMQRVEAEFVVMIALGEIESDVITLKRPKN